MSNVSKHQTPPASRLRKRRQQLAGRQVKVLASPVRQDIVLLLERSKALAATEIAASLGRSADGLYYHLRALVNAGVLVIRIPRGRNSGARYDLHARPTLLRYSPSSQAVRLVAGTLLRRAHRMFAQGLESPRARTQGLRRNVRIARRQGWLAKKELEQANRLLSALLALLSKRERSQPGCELLELTFVVTPVH